MVYSISTRSLINTAALCALGLSALPSARGDGSASSTIDICGISDGDKAAGIRVIDDTSCAGGGLGCYNDHCRYCKILETPQSSAFENCTTYGANFPTMSPLVASTGVCAVSSGDAAVGISAVVDDTCLYGGLGCFSDHCRFCKERSTSQSEAFVECSDYSSGSASTADAVTDAPSANTTSTSTAAPSSNTCTLTPADGDVEVGISIGTDTSCGAGGLGCINELCRFCRVRTTAKSAPYADCALLGTASTATNTTTTVDTPSGTAQAPASTTAAPSSTTAAPASITATETPAGTPAATSAATNGTAPEAPAVTIAASTTCTITPSVGDSAVGVGIATDATCKDGGVGCIDTICRFCKVTTSTQSAAFLDCALFSTGGHNVTDYSNASDDDDTSDASDASDTSDASDATDKSDDSDADDTSDASDATPPPDAGGLVSGATPSPDVTTAAPAPDATTEAPTSNATLAPDATTEAPASGATCTQVVSSGDAAVGINIVTDTSCSAGGVGCIDNVCRFCKVSETTQSSAFVDCISIAAATAAPDATTGAPAPDATTETPVPEVTTPAATDAAATPVPDATTEAPTTAASGACTQVVSSGDAAVGINIVTDTSCSAGGVGCIDNVCRFCKVSETTQSSAFVDCTSIAGATTTAEALTDNDKSVSTPLATSISVGANSAELVAATVACIGIIVAVVAIAVTARRSSSADNAAPAAHLDNEEDPERGEHKSPTTSSAAEDEPIVTAEA